MVRHCFPLTGDPHNPYCRGVEGLLENYITTLNTVTMAEPTVYREVLEYAANDSVRAGSDTEYTVVLLITDGGVTNLEQTKQVLVQLSRLAISVVLVGVGRGDMTHLKQLDSDKARLSAGDKQAVRDIVQFVGNVYSLQFGEVISLTFKVIIISVFTDCLISDACQILIINIIKNA